MSNKWQSARLNEVLTEISRPEKIDRGISYCLLGMRWYAQGLFIRENKFGHEIQANELYRVEKGDFVYNRLFAWKGSFGIVDDITSNEFVSGEFPCFKVNTEKVEPKFLHLYFSQEPIWNEIARISSGQTNISRLRLKVPTFLGMEIPLPPMEEQCRIVERIEALAARVEEAQRLQNLAIDEVEALWQSVLHNSFERLSGHKKILKDFATFISDGPHITPEYVESGIPFVTVRNIANRKLSFDNLKYISREQHDFFCQRVKPEFGDVLYTKDGTLGIPCFVDTNREFSFFVSVAIIKPKRELLDGRYLAYILDSPQVHEQVNANKTGAVLQHIVIRAIKALNLPIPSIEEQHEAVAYLDSVKKRLDGLRNIQCGVSRELKALLPSILDKAFKGEL